MYVDRYLFFCGKSTSNLRNDDAQKLVILDFLYQNHKGISTYMVQFSETHKSNSHYDVQTSGICDLFDTKITI